MQKITLLLSTNVKKTSFDLSMFLEIEHISRDYRKIH